MSVAVNVTSSWINGASVATSGPTHQIIDPATGQAVADYALATPADVDNAVDLSMAKTDAVTTATGAGMTAIARVAQAQVQLELMSPQAAARLNMLADAHSMVVLDQLVDLSRKVRRL